MAFTGQKRAAEAAVTEAGATEAAAAAAEAAEADPPHFQDGWAEESSEEESDEDEAPFRKAGCALPQMSVRGCSAAHSKGKDNSTMNVNNFIANSRG